MSKPAYSESVKQAARILHIEGLSSSQIKARLGAGTAGLSFRVDPSERTIDNWRAGWKKDGIIAQFAVRSGEEEAVEEAIYRQLLAYARYDMNQMGKAVADGTAGIKEVSRIGTYLKIIDATRYQRQLRAKAKAGKLSPQEGGHLGAASDMASPESTLGRLVREQKRIESDRTKSSQES